MNRRTFVALSVGAPFLSCIVVPTLLFGVLIGQWGTNLVWGPVFGFGWWVAQTLGGPEHFRAAATIGFLVWPPIVLWGLAVAARSVWRLEDARRRRLYLWLLAASCVPMVPAEAVMALYSDARVPPDFNLLMASW